MHILVISFADGHKGYYGPFPTFFKANEYGKIAKDKLDFVVGFTVEPLVMTPTMRVKFS